jgi:hypothetical protein
MPLGVAAEDFAWQSDTSLRSNSLPRFEPIGLAGTAAAYNCELVVALNFMPPTDSRLPRALSITA